MDVLYITVVELVINVTVVELKTYVRAVAYGVSVV